MKVLEKKYSKINIINLKNSVNYNNDMELLTKISQAKKWKFISFENSYNNWLKKLKF